MRKTFPSKVSLRRLPVWLLLVGVALSLSGCATSAFSKTLPSPVSEVEAFVRDFNSYKGSVCVGISGSYTDKEKALKAATENCCQFLAFSRGLAIQSTQDKQEDSRVTNQYFYSETIGGTIDSIYGSVARDMVVVDVKWYGGRIGAAVFATLPELQPLDIEIKGVTLDSDIIIPEHITATGESDSRYTNLVQALEASVFRSANSLLDKMTKSLVVSVTHQTTTTDVYRNNTYAIEGNKVEGFRPIALTYSEDTGRFICLTVAME